MNTTILHGSILNGVNAGLLDLMVVLAFLYLFFGLDDLFVDLIALFGRLGPRALTSADMRGLHGAPEKTIAIIVPAWKEGNIIDRMLVGNLRRLDYTRFHIFVGVYPNDPQTAEKVELVRKHYPNVHPVMNYKDGPTSKGQILNYVIKQILAFEHESGIRFDGFLMQDAEDIIHPKVLKLVNAKLDRYAFIQIPVFSLEVKALELVAGTYVDEFAENHTKDILVRERLGAAVPSAGVGTALSRRLVQSLLGAQNSQLFNEGALTEDYELGVRAHALGYTPHVACCHYTHPETGRREFIATREYFPKRFSRSVRQKTRWTVGIALQGWRNLGWTGSLSNVYFLARDRKGIVTNIATFLGYPSLLFTSGYAFLVDSHPMDGVFSSHLMQVMLSANFTLMTWRCVQRMRCVSRIYGFKAAIPVLVRWPLANTINALAAFHAMKNDLVARFTKATLAWVKTEHELPQYFGQPAGDLPATASS